MGQIDAMEYWTQQLANRSEKTRKLYVWQFNRFVEWDGRTPNELIEVAKESRKKSEDPRENQVLEAKVKAYLAYLEEKGETPATRRSAFTAIRSFFECNCFPLSLSNRDRPAGDSEGSRVPEREEVRRLLNAAKGRGYRAAILTLKDSGLRVSDLVRLRWSEAKDYGEGYWGWRIVTKKKKVKAICFVGPEATEALRLLDRKDDRIWTCSAKQISNVLSELAQAAGVKGVSAHGLRKFFSVEMEGARVPREYRLRMMGKATTAYDEGRDSKLFAAYQYAYDHLRVLGEGSAEVEGLRQSIEELREENKELREEIAGIKQVQRNTALGDRFRPAIPEETRRLMGEEVPIVLEQYSGDNLEDLKKIIKWVEARVKELSGKTTA